MGKNRDLLKKIRGREGSFHAKMGQIKDRSGVDLKKAEYIKKRLKGYIEELYKKDINDPDNHDGVSLKAATGAKSLQSCPTLSDPMDCNLPGSSVHGIFQARVLEWGAIGFSKRSTRSP